MPRQARGTVSLSAGFHSSTHTLVDGDGDSDEEEYDDDDDDDHDDDKAPGLLHPPLPAPLLLLFFHREHKQPINTDGSCSSSGEGEEMICI